MRERGRLPGRVTVGGTVLAVFIIPSYCYVTVLLDKEHYFCNIVHSINASLKMYFGDRFFFTMYHMPP